MDIMVNKTGRYEDNVKALLNSDICPISKDDISICEENIKVAALKYGNASAALKNTIVGDNACINISMLEEIINEHENGCNCEMTR